MASHLRQYSVKADNLSCDRGAVPVFRGARFAVSPGEAVQVMGANGAGKSSLLGLLAGHIKPAGGHIAWRSSDDEVWSANCPHDAVVFLGHERGAKPSLTVKENLAFWAARYQRQLSVAPALLSQLGLDAYANAPAVRLSAGQRRRLDLARLIIAERPVWLLDEPAAFVDERGAALIGVIVSEHQKRGGVAIIATHVRLDIQASTMTIG